MVGLGLAQGCDSEPAQPSAETTPETAEPSIEEESTPESLVITPGVGIGPAELGGQYSTLKAAYGEPDDITAYRRTFYISWDAPGLEVVVMSLQDEEPDDDAVIISVGTGRPDGFTGVVMPGMSRAEGDEILGPCLDVIDDKHCYHSAGVYFEYDRDGIIETVAIHPVYTPRPSPPEMLPALGLDGAQ